MQYKKRKYEVDSTSLCVQEGARTSGACNTKREGMVTTDQRGACVQGEVGEVWKRLGLDKQNDEALLKLWTIGVNPAVASDKTCTGAADECAEEKEADDGVWFPVELDVPGNQSGKMPYQALINFNKNTGGKPACQVAAVHA